MGHSAIASRTFHAEYVHLFPYASWLEDLQYIREPFPMAFAAVFERLRTVAFIFLHRRETTLVVLRVQNATSLWIPAAKLTEAVPCTTEPVAGEYYRSGPAELTGKAALALAVVGS